MAAAAIKLDRILCLEESVWDERQGLTDQTSVLPTLELLQRMGTIEEFVHRHAIGSTEFENYLSWRTRGRRMRTYGTIYLAFHGSRKGMAAGETMYSLDQLASLIGELPNGVVHLGSCSVLTGREEAAQRFLRETGARLVSGYQRDVEWLDSAALDTAWLGYVASYVRLGDAHRQFRKRYASVIDHLKWVAVAR